jgi:Ser/Thr protein kinase RdoA (MazF antagonist)
VKPYAELTYRGKLRRMRRLAELALAEFGLADASMRFFYQAGNTLYRVYAPAADSIQPEDDLFEPGQFLLRIYQPGWQTPQAIRLELAWLAAMRREAGLPVPEPMPGLDGGLLAHVSIPGIPQDYDCALLRWVKGRLVRGVGRPEHYLAQGRLMARIHNFTQHWQLPPAHAKRHYNWDGLFRNDSELALPPGRTWEFLPPDWVGPFEIVADRFSQLSKAWGEGPEVYGLIHADMGVKANLLFWRGHPHPIDFDGSGFGYWMYDLAVALTDCIHVPEYPSLRAALPDAHLAQLELFISASYVYYILWLFGANHLRPGYVGADLSEVIQRGAAFILRYVQVPPPNEFAQSISI